MNKKLFKNRIFLTFFISTIVFIVVASLAYLPYISPYTYKVNENLKNIFLTVRNQNIIKENSNTQALINNDIVVVTIDEKTLKEFGFPFSREKYARLIKNLNNAGTEVIGIDIIFADENKLDKKGDDEFAKAIKEANNIVLGNAIIAKDFDTEGRGTIESSLAKFEEGVIANGFFQPNIDSITNLAASFSPYRQHYNENGELKYYNSFSISILKAYYSKLFENENILNFNKEDEKNYYIRENQAVPFAQKGRKYVLINYIPLPNKNESKASRFPSYSFLDVYQNNIDPKVFDGKIVLIGATAKGLKDTFSTPNGTEYGVYVHANIVNTILTKNFLFIFDKFYEFSLIFLLILLSVYFNLSRSGKVLLFSNLSIVIIFLLIFPLGILFFTNFLLNYLFELLVALILSLIISNILKYLLENKDKIKLDNALSEYVSKAISKEILSGEGAINLDGERKKIVIYFSDIEGFTSISENMKAEELVAFLRDFLGNMSDVIMDEKGFINKYEGDAIMALWGVFIDYNKSSYHACLSIIKQQILLKELNKKWKNYGIPNINVRFGLHAGEAIVGNIGSKGRKMEFTALGDSVNLASRLEGVNKVYGTYSCVSEEIFLENKNDFEFRFLDTIRVIGKNIPVKIYELLDIKGKLSNNKKEIINKFEEAIEEYQNKNFKEALKIFEELSKLGDKPSEVYRNRCEEFLSIPPANDWDGVWNLDSK